MSNYLEKQDLCREIEYAKTNGYISENLTNMLNTLFKGISKRFYQGNQSDMVQILWTHFLAKDVISLLETNGNYKNPFNYITRMASNVIMNQSRQEQNKSKKLTALIENVRILATEKSFI
jgi:hypothetical protein